MGTDVVSFGETMLRLTAPGGIRLETTPTLQVYVGGSESNTLSALARLGLSVEWLSALPNNPPGKHVETELRSHGIQTGHVIWTTPAGRVGTFYVEEASQPLGLQVYYDRAHSACALIDATQVDYTLIDSARMLHLTGITPALSDQALTVFQHLLDRARTKHIPLSFDVNYRAKLWLPQQAATQLEEACRQSQVLFCARPDAAELWGFDGEPEDVLHQMARRFASHQEAERRFVLTLGSAGSAQLYHNTYTHEPAFATEGQVRFGSGDAFDAGYLYAILEGPLYQELHTHYRISPLAFGNALAALKRCIPGDIAIITPAEVVALFQQQEGRRFR